MNDDKIEELWKEILKCIDENPNREGLIDTPKRISKMYREIFKGLIETPPQVTTFNNGNDGLVYDEMITDEGTFYSHCEHHFVPFFGRYIFAYIPHPEGKILGLSKVARVVDYFSSKPQIQERLTHEIIDYIWNELCKDNSYPPIGMALYMEGEHLCKTMRGAKKKGVMTTKYLRGCFKDDVKARGEFLNSIK
jgi:GTP cyclohydrolase I